MMPTYGKYRHDLSPPWLRGERGSAWQAVFGEEQDAQIERARKAALAGYPEHAPAEFLGFIGDERQIDRGRGESEASYRKRLRMAMEIWRWAGTKRGLIAALEVAGFPSVWIVTNSEWEPLPPDEDPTHELNWVLYWVVIGQPHPFEDDGLWGDDSEWDEGGEPGLWGSNISEDDVALVQRIIRLWQPAHCVPVALVINLDSDQSHIEEEPQVVENWRFAELATGERLVVQMFD